MISRDRIPDEAPVPNNPPSALSTRPWTVLAATANSGEEGSIFKTSRKIARIWDTGASTPLNALAYWDVMLDGNTTAAHRIEIPAWMERGTTMAFPAV